MTNPVQLDPLNYYARHGCALFPIPAGSKNPTGIVESFKHDHSTDPATWQRWRTENPGCNFGIVAFASRLIIVDIDTKIGRDEAWALWCELCASWGLDAPLAPHTQSARGGWHVLCAVPDTIDPATLRQPDAIKGIINLRCVGYTVAAGSYYDGTAKGEASGPYTLLTDAPPHPAPQPLLDYCTRRPNPRPASGQVLPGSRDKGDVAALLQWLNERGAFADYESWFQVGMALKLEYGDDGFPLWELTFDETVTPDTATTKWQSFATDPTGQSVTLNTFLQRAHSLGWRGSVRKSAASMFDGVAALAAASGASLSSGLPTPPGPGGPVPMMAGQEELARICEPMLQAFLDDTADAPAAPLATDLPELPPSMAGHGLFSLMQDSLLRVFALAETPKLKAFRLNDPLAVLHQLHPDIFDSVCRRLQNSGVKLEHRKIKNTSAALQEQVERVTVTHEKWEYDAKSGEIQSDNPDNVVVLLGVLGLSIRWNAWLEQMEIQGGNDPAFRWPTWTYVDDKVIAKLLTRARRTKTRFRPGKDFLWETLITLSEQNTVDPVLDAIADLESKWDGVPRLITWLSRYCGTPCDVYHQAVGKLIFGGMILRARYPGSKFDFMPVFFGRQGTGKSTMAALLALRTEWFTDNVLLGDAAKELILALAGKLVAEIGEMGMRSNTNASAVKAMVSRQIDEGRTAYARAVTKRKRRNIFIGTTNDAQPLSDPTGNRRFLPVHITTEIDLAALRADIGQLIGEAAAWETQVRAACGELPRDVWPIADEYQERARQASDLEILVSDWFGADADGFIITADIVRLCDSTGRKNAGQAVYTIMERLGFIETALSSFGGKSKVKAWYRRAAGPMLPKNVKTLPQYQIDVSNGNARVVLRMPTQYAAISPPVPQR
jgi:hypothetical protein